MRALNFGIYSTDLVFASYFKLNVEVVRYYLTTKKLAEGLGVANAFSDADFVRLEANSPAGTAWRLSATMHTPKRTPHIDEQMGPTLAMVLARGLGGEHAPVAAPDREHRQERGADGPWPNRR